MKNVGLIGHNEPPHANSPGVATVLSHAACASMSTTTTTTTTRDRGDRYGPMEWAQPVLAAITSVIASDITVSHLNWIEIDSGPYPLELSSVQMKWGQMRWAIQMFPYSILPPCNLPFSHELPASTGTKFGTLLNTSTRRKTAIWWSSTVLLRIHVPPVRIGDMLVTESSAK